MKIKAEYRAKTGEIKTWEREGEKDEVERAFKLFMENDVDEFLKVIIETGEGVIEIKAVSE